MTDKTPVELGARSAMTDFLEDVAEELRRARRKHAPMHSLHEAYAVILEEMDEFWDEVRAWHGGSGQDADAKKARRNWCRSRRWPRGQLVTSLPRSCSPMTDKTPEKALAEALDA